METNNNNKDTRQNLSAALFLVGGILLIIFAVFTIGKDQGLAQGKFKIKALFNNVAGLTEGAQIRLSGVNVGTVESIDFLDKEIEGRRISVTMNILNKFKKQLQKSTRITIQTQGVLGDKLVEISVDQEQPPIDLTQPIIGENPIDVQDLTDVFINAAESFTETSKDLNEIDIAGLTDMLKETSESLLTTSQGFNKIMGEMEEITLKSKRLLDRVEQRIIDGNLFKVF